MNDLERREAFEKLKAKADEALQKKRLKRLHEKKMRNLRFDSHKAGAGVDHTLRSLEDPMLRQLTTLNNRPAEKLVKGKTKGMAKTKSRGREM